MYIQIFIFEYVYSNIHVQIFIAYNLVLAPAAAALHVTQHPSSLHAASAAAANATGIYIYIGYL